MKLSTITDNQFYHPHCYTSVVYLEGVARRNIVFADEEGRHATLVKLDDNGKAVIKENAVAYEEFYGHVRIDCPDWLRTECESAAALHAEVSRECAAHGGQGCQYGPHGPNGESQCKYCGEPDKAPDYRVYVDAKTGQVTGRTNYASGGIIKNAGDPPAGRKVQVSSVAARELAAVCTEKVIPAMQAASKAMDEFAEQCKEPIPPGVYFKDHNFYNARLGLVMPREFWRKWQHRYIEFPASPELLPAPGKNSCAWLYLEFLGGLIVGQPPTPTGRVVESTSPMPWPYPRGHVIAPTADGGDRSVGRITVVGVDVAESRDITVVADRRNFFSENLTAPYKAPGVHGNWQRLLPAKNIPQGQGSAFNNLTESIHRLQKQFDVTDAEIVHVLNGYLNDTGIVAPTAYKRAYSRMLIMGGGKGVTRLSIEQKRKQLMNARGALRDITNPEFIRGLYKEVFGGVTIYGCPTSQYDEMLAKFRHHLTRSTPCS